MANRGGMFVDPVPGTPPVGMGAVDGRLALGGLLGNYFQLASGGGVTQSTTAMSFTVAQSVWQIPDPNNTGAEFLSPTDTTALTTTSTGVTIPAGPSSGSRIDIIVVRQNNYAAGDSDSYVHLSYVTGVASGTPAAPAVPAGAQLYATINVPTNAANAAACTVSLAQQTQLAALPIIALTQAALFAQSGGELYERAYVVADPTTANNGTYQWSGSTWILLDIAADVVPQGSFGFGSGYSLGGDTQLFRQRGFVVGTLHIVRSSAFVSSDNMVVFPAGYRPTQAVAGVLGYLSASPSIGTFNISTSGVVNWSDVTGNGTGHTQARMPINFRCV